MAERDLLNKKIKNVIFVVILISILLLFPIIYFAFQNFIQPAPSNLQPFVIDEKGGGDYTWEEAKKKSWCSGAGTLEDPYIIEGIRIKGSRTTFIQYCIKVKNSNKPFIIRDSFFYNSHVGIDLENTHNGILIDNNCSDNYVGIDVDGNNNWLDGNILQDNTYGIRLDGENNNLTRNFINQSFGDSIYVSSSAKNTIIKQNTIFGAKITLYPAIYGDFSIEMDTSNTLNGNIIYLYVNTDYLTIDNFTNPGQIILGNCRDSIISHYNFNVQFTLANCDNITLRNLTISTSIELRHCDNFKIINNSLQMISFFYSDNNEIINNSFNAVGRDMYFIHSDGNIFRNNTFKNNGIWVNGNPNELLKNDIDRSNTINGKYIACYSNIRGLNQDNFTNSGMVILLNCSDSTVSNINIDKTYMGISVVGGENITLENNSVHDCYYFGIFLNGAINTSVINNTIRDNKNGIKIDDAKNTILKENDILNNKENGIELWETNFNEIHDNSIKSNKLGMYFIASKYNVVANNDFCENHHSGIYFTDCSCGKNTNNSILNNIFTENGEGINIRYSDSTEISGNEIKNNLKNGIYLHGSDFSKIYNNQISSNTEFGLYLIYSDNNDIFNNIFENNREGCYTEFSCEGNIFKNNICSSAFSQIIIIIIIALGLTLTILIIIGVIYYKVKQRRDEKLDYAFK